MILKSVTCILYEDEKIKNNFFFSFYNFLGRFFLCLKYMVSLFLTIVEVTKFVLCVKANFWLWRSVIAENYSQINCACWEVTRDRSTESERHFFSELIQKRPKEQESVRNSLFLDLLGKERRSGLILVAAHAIFIKTLRFPEEEVFSVVWWSKTENRICRPTW